MNECEVVLNGRRISSVIPTAAVIVMSCVEARHSPALPVLSESCQANSFEERRNVRCHARHCSDGQ
jgi:hypothetical protein